jgi:enoyl-[acyl-carrier-protein] reductase (NADH)
LGCVSGVISTWSCVPTQGSVTCYSFAMTGAYNSKSMSLSIAMLMKFTGLEIMLGCPEQKLKLFWTIQSLINEVHDNFVLRIK